MLSPCLGFVLLLLLEQAADGLSCVVPLVLGVGGLLLWAIARQATKQLLPGRWATLADVGLAALLAIAFLVVTAAMGLNARR
jgi:hypothetical protein